MKTLLALLCLALAASEHAGVEFPIELPEDTPHGQLVRWQLEEVALGQRYRDGHPRMIEVRGKIAALLTVPDIRNTVYFDVLTGRLADLREERAKMISRFRSENPRIQILDRQISFVEKALAERTLQVTAEEKSR